ncbi:MAG: hypothetical protein KFF73_04415 [Cyclobacteriaceae bacterium]|nr:hypothetical protein [Cyclobacteriaceae bacterium]
MEEDANYFKNEPWSNMINHEEYANTCFHYIHMNPVKAHLVPKMENWEMSSYRDYAGYRKISLCSKKLAYELMNIPEEPELFMKQSNNQILCNHMSW